MASIPAIKRWLPLICRPQGCGEQNLIATSWGLCIFTTVEFRPYHETVNLANCGNLHLRKKCVLSAPRTWQTSRSSRNTLGRCQNSNLEALPGIYVSLPNSCLYMGNLLSSRFPSLSFIVRIWIPTVASLSFQKPLELQQNLTRLPRISGRF